MSHLIDAKQYCTMLYTTGLNNVVLATLFTVVNNTHKISDFENEVYFCYFEDIDLPSHLQQFRQCC